MRTRLNHKELRDAIEEYLQRRTYINLCVTVKKVEIVGSNVWVDHEVEKSK
jgi:hypothetical protein